MNYARRTDRVFSTQKPVVTKKSMSEEVASRRQFIDSHSFIITVDPATKKASIAVEEKHAD